jgi:hypothetical protein
MDEFYLAVRCAVTGFYSRALYRRGPDGKFIPKSPLKKIEAARANAQGAATGPPPQIAASAMRVSNDPCPWCEAKLDGRGLIKCGICERLVCLGRSYLQGGKVIFVCHEDCGAHAPVAGSITSYGVDPTTPPAAPPPPASEHPALPAASKQPGQALALPGKGKALKK